ncbi:MAG: cytidine deaminase [candidate division WOR-3 bacterium]
MKLSKLLIKRVKEVIKFSYAPYSEIRVGAGLYCKGEKIYTGSNIENSSYSLSMCAERVALFKALSEGERNFLLLLLYSPEIEFILPCGACLQVLSEFAPELVIVSMNNKEEFQFHSLRNLIKNPFKL